MRSTTFAIVSLVLAALLAGCGEKPQTLQARQGGEPAWKGAADPYVAPGWNVGDEKSWEAQMRNRALRGQDEYQRTRGAT